ncbi:MAG: prephenate dehydratase domain-containing protein, partial [Thermoguttaceae bacterium]
DPSREREILSNITSHGGETFEEYIKVLFSVLFDLSKSYQIRYLTESSALGKEIDSALANTPKVFPKKAVVACSGVEGAYSQQACDRLFSLPSIMYFKNFEGVFQAVAQGLCKYGILPIENSTYGSVLPVYDLMTDYRFHIVRAYKMTISHSLLVKPGTEKSQIREIWSHEQALGQCSEFLKTFKDVQIIPCDNTAEAAKKVATSERTDMAAIASKNCTELYGLKVLEDSVENSGNNFTRFICISRDLEIYPGSNKISLIVNLPHKPGALYATIAKFAALGLNLSKLESRPIPGKDFEFLFYFDLDVSDCSPEVIRLLSDIEKRSNYFAFLGCYSE